MFIFIKFNSYLAGAENKVLESLEFQQFIHDKFMILESGNFQVK